MVDGVDGEMTAKSISPSGALSKIHVDPVDGALAQHHIRFFPCEKGEHEYESFSCLLFLFFCADDRTLECTSTKVRIHYIGQITQYESLSFSE